MNLLKEIQTLIRERAGDQSDSFIERIGEPSEELLTKALTYHLIVDIPRRMLDTAGFTGKALHALVEHERNYEIGQLDQKLDEVLAAETSKLGYRSNRELASELESDWDEVRIVLDQFAPVTGLKSDELLVHRRTSALMEMEPEDVSMIGYFSWPRALGDLTNRIAGAVKPEPILFEQKIDGEWVDAMAPRIPTGDGVGEMTLEDLTKAIEGLDELEQQVVDKFLDMTTGEDPIDPAVSEEAFAKIIEDYEKAGGTKPHMIQMGYQIQLSAKLGEEYDDHYEDDEDYED